MRGENGPGVWALTSIAPGVTSLEWLLDTDLRGWVPRGVIQGVLGGVMAGQVCELRARVRDLGGVKDAGEEMVEDEGLGVSVDPRSSVAGGLPHSLPQCVRQSSVPLTDDVASREC